MIHPSGTFNYIGEVPASREDARWTMPLRLVEDLPPGETRLLGHSPTMTVVDIGVPKDPSPSRPFVAMCELTLDAAAGDAAPARQFVTCVDHRLPKRWQPGDRIQLMRDGRGGLGLACRRGHQLLIAVGCVSGLELGSEIIVSDPYNLMERAEAVLREVDPDFRFQERPVMARSGGHCAVLFRGYRRVGAYEISVTHGALDGIPGTAECGAVYVPDVYSRATAMASADLIVSGALRRS